MKIYIIQIWTVAIIVDSQKGTSVMCIEELHLRILIQYSI